MVFCSFHVCLNCRVGSITSSEAAYCHYLSVWRDQFLECQSYPCKWSFQICFFHLCFCSKGITSDALAFESICNGGASRKLHCVATLFCSSHNLSVCVFINNAFHYYAWKVRNYNLPLSLPYIHTDTQTDFILEVGICVAASDVESGPIVEQCKSLWCPCAHSQILYWNLQSEVL